MNLMSDVKLLDLQFFKDLFGKLPFVFGGRSSSLIEEPQLTFLPLDFLMQVSKNLIYASLLNP